MDVHSRGDIRRPTGRSPLDRMGGGAKAVLGRLFPPQHYAAPLSYRPPAAW